MFAVKKSPTPVTSPAIDSTPKRFIPPRRIAYNNSTTNKNTTAGLNQINAAKGKLLKYFFNFS